jgi:hypothetical protein
MELLLHYQSYRTDSGFVAAIDLQFVLALFDSSASGIVFPISILTLKQDYY